MYEVKTPPQDATDASLTTSTAPDTPPEQQIQQTEDKCTSGTSPSTIGTTPVDNKQGASTSTGTEQDTEVEEGKNQVSVEGHQKVSLVGAERRIGPNLADVTGIRDQQQCPVDVERSMGGVVGSFDSFSGEEEQELSDEEDQNM